MTEEQEPKCRHGYPQSECFTCHVDKSAGVMKNEKGELVYYLGQAAIKETLAQRENLNPPDVLQSNSDE